VDIRDAVEGYLLFKSARASPRTIETDIVILRQFSEWVGETDVTSITPETVRDYLAYHVERGLSPYTVRRHHASVSALFSWLSSLGIELVSSNPCATVPKPRAPKRKPKTLSEDDVNALLAACSKSRNPRRDKALVLFMLDTGARASEIASVSISDVGFNSGRVRVVGKGDKERYVYLGKRALAALWLYVKDERQQPTQVGAGNLFLTDDGYQLNRDSLRRIVQRLGDKAGIKAYPHQFRHTAAIEHLRHGMDLVSIQRLLGHESLQTTRIYLEALNDEDVEKRARQTSPADNWKL
jgi:site-specific recombinase XerD